MSKTRDIRKEKKTAPRATAEKSGKPQNSPISALRSASRNTQAKPKSKM